MRRRAQGGEDRHRRLASLAPPLQFSPITDMDNPFKIPAASTSTPPNSARSLQFLAASMLAAGVMAVSWFEMPPIPALVGVLGAGGILFWRRRK
jgi:hypothetical protein